MIHCFNLLNNYYVQGVSHVLCAFAVCAMVQIVGSIVLACAAAFVAGHI